MYERFTAPARKAVASAHEEARELGALEAGTEHLLLALCRVDTWVGDLLQGLGASHARLRGTLEPGPGSPDHVPIGSDLRLAFEAALRRADEHGRRGVGCEHLLHGVVEVGGVAALCLQEAGVVPDDVRRMLEELGASPVADEDEDGLAELYPIAPVIANLEGDVGVGQAEPRCPSCAHPLAAAVRHVRVPVDIEVTVDLVYCGRCGHVLTTRIVERG